MLLTTWSRGSAAVLVPPQSPLPGPTRTIRPLPEDVTADNRALFVGINSYSECPSLSTLGYAVDDAVAQAHLFVKVLGLVPARNVWIAISDEPVECKQEADDLRALGAHFTKATFPILLQDIDAVCLLGKFKIAATASPDRLIVVSFSCHGIKINGVNYYISSDAAGGHIDTTSISESHLRNSLHNSGAAKGLLLVDACRKSPQVGAKGLDDAIAKDFCLSYKKSRGEAVFSSCVSEESSYEDKSIKHGVFTYYLLQSLGGLRDAPAMDDGVLESCKLDAVDADAIVRVRGVARCVGQSVKAHVIRKWSDKQSPFLEAGEAAQIPLAICPEVEASLRARLDGFRERMAGRVLLCNEGVSLLGKDPIDLTEPERRRRAVFEKVADGSLPLKDLDAKLSEPAADDPIAQLNARATNGDKWAMLLFSAVLREQRVNQLSFDALLDSWNIPQTEADTVSLARRAVSLDVARSDVKSLGFVRVAASGDHPLVPAMLRLAVCYENGIGTNPDPTKARAWYEKAAVAGSVDGMLGLGFLLQSGSESEALLAIDWYKRAAELNSVVGAYYLGRLLVSRGEKDLGEQHIRSAAQKGYPPAVRWLKDYSDWSP